ncbi:hypothetical protein GLAREA_10315 [Glarea lozoyensis ATCC 20868]|uniref:DNA repair protein rad9 n=1 Tax=Glarea lozoyensis (strain ATCC 20868 / MF5171) TaxID=1116229 RepID=S3DRJ2_GLAL2|nr:uncharacterized protein GLAREA_10315 [Glarea lozoyensis ATCC 20868]EPE34621.1 hypothetical protein GLAREA_10315 [Glarea lozoyensis ATCC 20868]
MSNRFKALLSVFKARVGDPSRERDTAVERAEITVEDEEGKSKSRFTIRIICRHGVIKTYRLTFEAIPPMHALFVKANANNMWSISSRTLRDFVEHFGPGTEQLDIYSEDGRVSLTSYTEKIMSGNEILKQPLHTSIAIDSLEFAEFSVEELLHIVISVKDFKSIITHAGITSTIVKACYSRPASPMQLTYSDDGILSEFILMTIGEVRGGSATPAPNAPRAGPKRQASRQPVATASASKRATPAEMPPPPPRSASMRELSKTRDVRPSPPPPQPSIPSDALFMPRADDDNDKMWDPVNQEDDDDDMLLWGQGGGENDATVNSTRTQHGVTPSMNSFQSNMSREALDRQLAPTQRLPPTQKLSQARPFHRIKGMFDD